MKLILSITLWYTGCAFVFVEHHINRIERFSFRRSQSDDTFGLVEELVEPVKTNATESSITANVNVATEPRGLAEVDEVWQWAMGVSVDEVERMQLRKLAEELNPAIKFFDPLGLADARFWGTTNAQTISYLRHSEMKHGRVAMLAFLGYTAQANHIIFPWCTADNGFPPSELSPPDQWDYLFPVGKLQIIFFVGLLEIWSEFAGTHYMRGGVPGKFPTSPSFPMIPSLWDPLGLIDAMDPSERRYKLAKEINNGRLAMLGCLGYLVESKVPGSVPLLSGIVTPYEGMYMLPFGYLDVINWLFKDAAYSSESSVIPFWS